MMSPFKRGSDLDDAEAGVLRDAINATLGRAIEHYEQALTLPIPDKLPMPLTVSGATASRARAVAPGSRRCSTRTT
jgi:hypothetical protein